MSVRRGEMMMGDPRDVYRRMRVVTRSGWISSGLTECMHTSGACVSLMVGEDRWRACVSKPGGFATRDEAMGRGGSLHLPVIAWTFTRIDHMYPRVEQCREPE